LNAAKAALGHYTSTQATTGTAIYIPSPTTGIGSVLELDSNSTTDTQGIQVQYPASASSQGWHGHLLGNDGSAKDIATAPEFFAGMSVLDRNETTIIASGAMSASDWIGFYDVTDGTLSFGVEDGSQDISANTAHTLVDADVTTDGSAWVRLGFRWEVGTKLEAYVNGATVDISDVAESNAPDTAIACSYVCQSNGTTDSDRPRGVHGVRLLADSLIPNGRAAGCAARLSFFRERYGPGQPRR
jgi:hypothetical protein